MTTPQLDNATAKVRATADALARAYNYEHELEDLRAAIKADAIKRIMVRDGVAATPAEKIVETDAEYFTHRGKQAASIVARFKADAEYWAAKCEATNTSLITPDVFALSEEINELELAMSSRARAFLEAQDTIALLTEENASLQRQVQLQAQIQALTVGASA